ncbi:MAG: hypothetical protein HQK79_20765 [Desulfobacterales bacterium]|nr:hypothetical protein [Desulfobacterales bacterium]
MYNHPYIQFEFQCIQVKAVLTFVTPQEFGLQLMTPYSGFKISSPHIPYFSMFIKERHFAKNIGFINSLSEEEWNIFFECFDIEIPMSYFSPPTKEEYHLTEYGQERAKEIIECEIMKIKIFIENKDEIVKTYQGVSNQVENNYDKTVYLNAEDFLEAKRNLKMKFKKKELNLKCYESELKDLKKRNEAYEKWLTQISKPFLILMKELMETTDNDLLNKLFSKFAPEINYNPEFIARYLSIDFNEMPRSTKPIRKVMAEIDILKSFVKDELNNAHKQFQEGNAISALQIMDSILSQAKTLLPDGVFSESKGIEDRTVIDIFVDAATLYAQVGYIEQAISIIKQIPGWQYYSNEQMEIAKYFCDYDKVDAAFSIVSSHNHLNLFIHLINKEISHDNTEQALSYVDQIMRLNFYTMSMICPTLIKLPANLTKIWSYFQKLFNKIQSIENANHRLDETCQVVLSIIDFGLLVKEQQDFTLLQEINVFINKATNCLGRKRKEKILKEMKKFSHVF